MPTVMIVGPYRFFFYSADGVEPPHIHVERDDKIAKFWLSPTRLRRSGGFKAKDLNHIQNLIEINHDTLLEAWDEFFTH